MTCEQLCALFVLSFQLGFVYGNKQDNNTGCSVSEPSCLKCGNSGCVKCPSSIVFPGRNCVADCPYGYRSEWSTMPDVMGRVCVYTGNLIGVSNHTLTILAGVLCGFIICFFIVASAIIYVQHQRRKLMEQSSEAGSDLDDSPERKDFLKQLETIRPYAKTFLEMLNDTRKQLREQHLNGDTTATAAYRPVLRDLAKILLLLNRPVDRITIPDDWDHLLNWAEKTLKRYKRMSDISQPQVAQLINFLQGPVLSVDYNRGSTTMSTFKPDQSLGSSLSLENVPAKSVDSNILNPQWRFEYSIVNDDAYPTSQFNPAEWKNSKEYLNNPYFFDDDFCQLGFRPQDEITTEL